MDIKALLEELIENAARKMAEQLGFSPEGLPEIILEVPPQKEFGDFATNFAMQSARVAKMNPRKLAQTLVEQMHAPWLEKCEIAGPGFINFYLRPDWLYTSLRTILAAGDAYGNLPAREEGQIQVEYVSANPTGPLHVGHGRGAAFGSALVNLLRAAGYSVSAEYYINDAGNQIDHLAASVEARYLELLGQQVEFPEDGYRGQDIVQTAQRIVDQCGSRYLMVTPAERKAVFKELALEEKLAVLREDLEQFRVYFDLWFSERTLHEQKVIDRACQEIQRQGYLYEKEGAQWLKSTAFGDDKDRVVIRDNGVPTYLAADIAYHRDKLERGFATLINIWGADHHGYICRVKAALAALGYKPEQLEVLILQMVNLIQDGKPVQMSKRTGTGVTLSELMEEVGVDAARYFFIMRSIDSQLDFDLDLAKSKSNENPVYYIQYAHARICSIFRQMQELGVAVDHWQQADFSLLTEPQETDLIRKLAAYPEEIEQAAAERAPHRIARYCHELAGLFHGFYNQCRIIGTEPEKQQARLGLVTAVRNNLRHGFRILGIEAPEHM